MLVNENAFTVGCSADLVLITVSDLRQKIAKVMFLVLRVRRAWIVAWNFEQPTFPCPTDTVRQPFRPYSRLCIRRRNAQSLNEKRKTACK